MVRCCSLPRKIRKSIGVSYYSLEDVKWRPEAGRLDSRASEKEAKIKIEHSAANDRRDCFASKVILTDKFCTVDSIQ